METIRGLNYGGLWMKKVGRGRLLCFGGMEALWEHLMMFRSDAFRKLVAFLVGHE